MTMRIKRTAEQMGILEIGTYAQWSLWLMWPVDCREVEGTDHRMGKNEKD
jgi:hypothetical protein